MVEDPGAARLGQELGAEADQAARRHEVLHARPAGAVVDHLRDAALAEREQLRDDADVVLGHVDRDALDRLVPLAVDLLRQHLGLADRQLEALAAHQLDEHRELELAAALHLPGVRPRGGEDAQRDVADELLLEARLDLARGQPVALGAGERARVDADRDRQARLVDGRDRAAAAGRRGRRSSRRSSRPAGPRARRSRPGPASSAGTRSSASVM